MVLALVLLGHLVLLAWWRERPMPAMREEQPVLLGRLLRDQAPPARAPGSRPALLPQNRRAPSITASPRASTSQPEAAGPAATEERMTAATVQARQRDLGMAAAPAWPARSSAENNVARSAAQGAGHAFGPHAASAPYASGPVQESRGAAGRWQARVDVGGSAYCLQAQDPSLRRDPLEKPLAVPSTCR
ncbi:hypothetical protein [Ralstonia mannitolilytica]|uniref:hypothetical protein n=1 Tax=Ralstonia mannitolilytica TaxID=105219 RepID=UPI0028F6214B|nr:hypothetical protein [Ralstonia mannitolilytica]CAJ0710711.1 hypothetical protein LMG8323_01271 [Ralstonia mannitolilytica]